MRTTVMIGSFQVKIQTQDIQYKQEGC